MIDMATLAALALLSLSGLLCLARLLRPGSLADKVVALDALLIVITSGIAVGAVWSGSTAFLDVLVVVALLGFIGTVAASRFMERRGAG